MVYNPEYAVKPFTDFGKVGPVTDLGELNLNWRECDLPERERTKHVHRLHPYLGKFIPQLVEIFIRKYEPKLVIDPFCGSGTTLVEGLSLGVDSFGCDISEFNCLLTRVKTTYYELGLLEKEIRDILQRYKMAAREDLFGGAVEVESRNEYLRKWFAPKALNELLIYKSLIPDYKYQDVMKIILSRSARSARLTTHFDLDFPKEPTTEPYYCYKHGRTCYPTENADKFISRYSLDTLRRIKEFAFARGDAKAEVVAGDARELEFPAADIVITSPPYVGLIDYHEQHRYAYELLGLKNNEEAEIGAAKKGRSQKATDKYVEGITRVFKRLKRFVKPDCVFVVIANDSKNVYPQIANASNFEVINELSRHVNRRTGRRATDFFEKIFIWENPD
ncbi:MAG TPA: DNA methyltransferase [bacterium]|nr:DNA methyltransferase [bacterium]